MAYKPHVASAASVCYCDTAFEIRMRRVMVWQTETGRQTAKHIATDTLCIGVVRQKKANNEPEDE